MNTFITRLTIRVQNRWGGKTQKICIRLNTGRKQIPLLLLHIPRIIILIHLIPIIVVTTFIFLNIGIASFFSRSPDGLYSSSCLHLY